ncbi:MAG: hypothetical protein E6767_12580 [Dysgonomonas sp.]|nr:hypothetical protein [Dysgonomonas sp.]
MKKLFYFLPIFISVCLFTACSSDDDNDPPAPDPTPLIAKMERPNGMTFTYDYTAEGTVKTLKKEDGGKTSVETFSYGSNGALVKVEKKESNVLLNSTEFVYDGTKVIATYSEYFEGAVSDTKVYTLQLNGDKLTESTLNTTGGMPGATFTIKVVSSYTYDANGNMKKLTSKTYFDDVLNETYNTTSEYEYDSNKSFIGKEILPYWYCIFSGTERFGIYPGYINNPSKSTTTALNWMGIPETLILKYVYEYNDKLYPTSVYSLLPIEGADDIKTDMFTFTYK